MSVSAKVQYYFYQYIYYFMCNITSIIIMYMKYKFHRIYFIEKHPILQVHSLTWAPSGGREQKTVLYWKKLKTQSAA